MTIPSLRALIGSIVVSCVALLHAGGTALAGEPGGFLFVTFRGEATPMTEQVYFMVSADGRDWKALNEGEPVLVSTLGERGVRDPYIIRSPDGGRFYLIATDLSIHLTRHDWQRAQERGSRSIVVWESDNLVDWSEPRLVRVAPDDAGCTWAPEAIYDEQRGEYLVFWASKTAGDGFAKHRIWAAWTKDFRSFGEPFVYIEKPTTVIDTTIVRDGGTYYRFTKDERDKAITMETSRSLMTGWQDVDGFTLSRLTGYEGPACFLTSPAQEGRSAEWCLLLDWYSKGEGYQPYIATDLSSGRFVEAPGMRFPFHPVRHGGVIPITADEMKRLNRAWGSLEVKAGSASVKSNNIVVDRDAGTVVLPVLPGTDVSSLDPKLEVTSMAVTPTGPQDFSGGPVEYTVDGDLTFRVSTVEHHNPALAGYFADPDCIYSNKTGRYYIYPTSDGHDGWSGTDFRAFSSPDLVHWTDEGVILDLKKDVSWTDRNAWAPSIIETETGDGQFRYFYYFTAAQRIGVAESDHPAGPFVDSGRPLIDWKPDGVSGGQEIDPDVFHDPATGKHYLYWGNGYLAVAELEPSMTEVDRASVRVMTPDRTFREGVHVFYRKGLYYFMWSEDDTRSPNYRVRYATARSPLGPLEVPEDNLVIASDDDAGIYATGHNSTIQVPGRDEWYIVYHRFTYPNGIGMGSAGGFHREVCIDRMRFDAAGRIIRVVPTHAGIEPVGR